MGELVTSRPGGGVQAVRGGRKLFGKKRRKIFVEHLAATCNVKRSAAAAGVSFQCVYQRRMRDAAFRNEWQAALEQGYARLETMLLARAMGEEAAAIHGDLDLGPPVTGEGRFDTDLALHLLREHKKGLAGIARGPQPTLRGAEWGEVEAYFIGRLKALKARLDPPASEGGAATAEGPLHRPALPDGPPPRPGEEL